VAFGDCDNDNKLDLLLAGLYPDDNSTTATMQIVKFVGTVSNTAPDAPAAGSCSSSYDVATGSVCLRWGYGSDGSDSQTTPEKGLYYDVRVASCPITDS
jgi:hypothetical protein